MEPHQKLQKQMNADKCCFIVRKKQLHNVCKKGGENKMEMFIHKHWFVGMKHNLMMMIIMTRLDDELHVNIYSTEKFV